MTERSMMEQFRVRPGKRLLLIDAPEGFLDDIEVPEGTSIVQGFQNRPDVILFFVTDAEGVQRALESADGTKGTETVIWFNYPKKTSGIKTDIDRDIIWEMAKMRGMDAVANFSVDKTWSALRVKKMK